MTLNRLALPLLLCSFAMGQDGVPAQNPLDQKVVFKVYDIPIADALKKLADQLGLALTLSDDVRLAAKKDLAREIAMNFGRGQMLDEILQMMLKQTRMVHSIVDGNLIISLVPDGPKSMKAAGAADVILVVSCHDPRRVG